MLDVEEILEDIPDKRENKGTTSLQFKRDLIDFFLENSELNDRSVIELGTHYGYTTKVLSYLFREVITFDNSYQMTSMARAFNQERDNIVYFTEDVYNYDWWPTSEAIGAVFIDTVHTYENVVLDIENCLKIDNECYIIFDDYGLFENVKKAVDEYVESKKLKFVKHIGETAGSDCRPGKALKDWEGIICRN